MTIVTSTCAYTIEYDENTEDLTITFHRGGQVTYTYEDVPAEVHSELINAGSIGSYFNSNIRNEYTFR